MAARRTLRPLARPLRAPTSPPPPPPPRPSTVALGTAYERATATFLAQAPQYTFEGIVRVGGKGDQGIDLRARWHLASSSHPSPTLPHPVIVQCKAESSPIGPATVRELEGTLAAQHPSPSSPSSVPHIALLVALSGFTEAAIRHARSSTRPLALLHLEPLPVPGAGGDEGSHDWVRLRAGTVTARLVSASWNRALEGLVARARAREGEDAGEGRRAVHQRGRRDGEDGRAG